MTEITIDFSEVDEGFQPLPAGTYVGMVDEAKLYVGKRSGSQYISLRFDVIDSAEYTGRKLYTTASLLPQSMWRTKKTLRALGVNVDGLTSIQYDELTKDLLHPDLLGKTARLVVAVEDFVRANGEPSKRNTVLDVLPEQEESGNKTKSITMDIKLM